MSWLECFLCVYARVSLKISVAELLWSWRPFEDSIFIFISIILFCCDVLLLDIYVFPFQSLLLLRHCYIYLVASWTTIMTCCISAALFCYSVYVLCLWFCIDSHLYYIYSIYDSCFGLFKLTCVDYCQFKWSKRRVVTVGIRALVPDKP